MKLKQFTALCAIVDAGFNVSRAAESMHAAQPGVSKLIKTLEDELGFEVLARQRKRITGLTRSGHAVIEVAKRIARDTELLKAIRSEALSPNTGELTVATTHIHARYTLLEVIKQFCRAYPAVSFTLRHSVPADIAGLVSEGTVDLGISVAPEQLPENVACLPCYEIRRVLITPKGHPLMKLRQLSFEAISRYPLVVYDARFSSGWRVLKEFSKRGLAPRVVLTAIDAEVVKAYVAEGLGVAILQRLAYNAARDNRLEARSLDHMMQAPTAMVMVRKHGFLRNFTYHFIELIQPNIGRSVVDAALQRRQRPAARAAHSR